MKQSCAVPSEEFTGHCLALTLLGSYLTDAYDGDVRCREEVSKHLAHDVRQGTHARRVWDRTKPSLGKVLSCQFSAS